MEIGTLLDQFFDDREKFRLKSVAAKPSRFSIETNLSEINTIHFTEVYICVLKILLWNIRIEGWHYQQEFPYESVNREVDAKTKSE